MTKSSPSIWHLLYSIKSTVKISSNFMAFLENINFKRKMQLCFPCQLFMSLLYLLPSRSRRLLEFLLKNVSFYRKRDVKVGISTWSQRSTKRAYSRLPNKRYSCNKQISILHWRRSKNVGVHLFSCTSPFDAENM